MALYGWWGALGLMLVSIVAFGCEALGPVTPGVDKGALGPSLSHRDSFELTAGNQGFLDFECVAGSGDACLLSLSMDVAPSPTGGRYAVRLGHPDSPVGDLTVAKAQTVGAANHWSGTAVEPGPWRAWIELSPWPTNGTAFIVDLRVATHPYRTGEDRHDEPEHGGADSAHWWDELEPDDVTVVDAGISEGSRCGLINGFCDNGSWAPSVRCHVDGVEHEVWTTCIDGAWTLPDDVCPDWTSIPCFE